MRGDIRASAADRAPVAPGVFQEGVVLRQPYGPLPALGQVVGDDAGDLPALSATGAVAEEEALAELHGAGMVVLDQDHLVRGLTEDPRTGQHGCVGFACVDDRFQLGVGHQGLAGDPGGQDGPIGWRRWRDRGHGPGFHERGGVRRGPWKADTAERIGLVEADVVALAGPGAGLISDGRRLRQEGQAVGGRRQRPGPGNQQRGMVHGSELARLRRRPRRDAGRDLRRIAQGLGRKDLRKLVTGLAAIDHEQGGVDGGPVPGVRAGGEGQAQDDATAAREGRHGRRVIEQPGGYDCREASAIGQAVQR